MRLAGRRVVVTGATRGLGRAVAIACAEQGARVGVGYRDESAAARVVEAIAALGAPAAVPLALDVTDPAGVSAAVERFVAEAGGVDGWVSNAATHAAGLLVTLDDAAVEAQIATNLVGAIHCARAVIPVMMRQRRGVLVHVSSVAAVRPASGQAVYAATKGALEALTRALAVEYARKGVRVVCVRPGPIATDMLAGTLEVAEAEVVRRVPLGRVAQAHEVAAEIAFLLGDEAAFITGSVHAVDGGYAA